MRPTRIIAAIALAATVAATGSYLAVSTATHVSTTYRADPSPPDRQAPIYAAVLRQYLTSGGGHHGGDAGFRFPHIFVLDRAAAGGGVPSWQAAAGGAPISPTVRRSITQALADVGPLTFVPSPDAVIIHGCDHVRDRGILITLGQVDGVGDQVQVGVYGFVACLAGSSLIYRVEQTSSGWRVAGVAVRGPVA
jgi:hypothetical protein